MRSITEKEKNKVYSCSLEWDRPERKLSRYTTDIGALSEVYLVGKRASNRDRKRINMSRYWTKKGWARIRGEITLCAESHQAPIGYQWQAHDPPVSINEGQECGTQQGIRPDDDKSWRHQWWILRVPGDHHRKIPTITEASHSRSLSSQNWLRSRNMRRSHREAMNWQVQQQWTPPT